MQWINYHHLLYFWTVAKEGNIADAATRLRVSQPTISTQIRTLEDALGVELFDRSGRRLVLSELGQVAFRYAEQIFSLGREMVDVLHERPTGQPLQMVVGVTYVVPKLIAYRLLMPAFGLSEGLHVTCREDRFDRLLGQLARHELDLVLSDVPIGPDISVKAFNHLLGSSGVTFFASPALAAKYKRDFPKSLDGAPFLLPMAGSAVRRELDRWFDEHDLRPEIVGQFDDSALLKVFGQRGVGVFAGPTAIETEIKQEYGVHVVGRSDTIQERFYAITVERRLKHPGVVAVSKSAKATLFL
ncbi:Transcriptional regulator, LysR family protein [Enhygromyxa salina]|uniref:Transcriptional regulator, LysR family protein n=1 Tax=Enhygromyxa salina TaxID=215803 RepID=A0A0C2A4G7_9BACT|nr:transcriptional activator NhaR [Enhygromyxa salina]KIG18263.1 Transcriptional regulator, LysR family protein [Enhygromyxa salina]